MKQVVIKLDELEADGDAYWLSLDIVDEVAPAIVSPAFHMSRAELRGLAVALTEFLGFPHAPTLFRASLMKGGANGN